MSPAPSVPSGGQKGSAFSPGRLAPLLWVLVGMLSALVLILGGVLLHSRGSSRPASAPVPTATPAPVQEAAPSAPTPAPSPSPEPTPVLRSESRITSGEFYLQSAYDGSYLGCGKVKRNPQTGKSGFYLSLVSDIEAAVLFTPSDFDGRAMLLSAVNVADSCYLDAWTSTQSGGGADLWVKGKSEDQRWMITRAANGQYIVSLLSDPDLVLRNISSTQGDVVSVGAKTNDDRQYWNVVSAP